MPEPALGDDPAQPEKSNPTKIAASSGVQMPAPAEECAPRHFRSHVFDQGARREERKSTSWELQ